MLNTLDYKEEEEKMKIFSQTEKKKNLGENGTTETWIEGISVLNLADTARCRFLSSLSFNTHLTESPSGHSIHIFLLLLWWCPIFFFSGALLLQYHDMILFGRLQFTIEWVLIESSNIYSIFHFTRIFAITSISIFIIIISRASFSLTNYKVLNCLQWYHSNI